MAIIKLKEIDEETLIQKIHEEFERIAKRDGYLPGLSPEMQEGKDLGDLVITDEMLIQICCNINNYVQMADVRELCDSLKIFIAKDKELSDLLTEYISRFRLGKKNFSRCKECIEEKKKS